MAIYRNYVWCTKRVLSHDFSSEFIFNLQLISLPTATTSFPYFIFSLFSVHLSLSLSSSHSSFLFPIKFNFLKPSYITPVRLPIRFSTWKKEKKRKSIFGDGNPSLIGSLLRIADSKFIQSLPRLLVMNYIF